jgi:AcrR family transcriptional regulator
MEAFSPSPGLRERKKQRTRETIIRVALELFAERGYEHTTIAEIADAADVSPRTIFAYFPSKEEIVFCDLPDIQERLAQALRERPAGTTALDALGQFIAESFSRDSYDVLRKRIVASDEALRRSQRARFAPLEQLIVEAITEDLHTGPDDIRPRIVAATIGAAFNAVHDRDVAAPPESFSPEQTMAVINDVMGFLRGGLEALRGQ